MTEVVLLICADVWQFLIFLRYWNRGKLNLILGKFSLISRCFGSSGWTDFFILHSIMFFLVYDKFFRFCCSNVLFYTHDLFRASAYFYGTPAMGLFDLGKSNLRADIFFSQGKQKINLWMIFSSEEKKTGFWN